jgi:thioredoxin-related protein
MKNLQQKLQLTANILIIVVALLIGGVFVKRNFLPGARNSNQPELPKIGDKVQLADFDWSKKPKNVLLVLQKGCGFCTSSAGFYKQLIQQTKDSNVKIVAVFPQGKEEAEQYLNELGISGLEIKQSQLDTLLVAGTPTIIVADEKGQITDTWIGRLPPEKETEVLGKLKS